MSTVADDSRRSNAWDYRGLRFLLNDQRTAQAVFEKHTEDYEFSQNSPRLVSPYTIKLPMGDFPSRSEAKKVLAGATAFKSLIVDFKDVASIGQGFADEMFRVFQQAHPDIEIAVINANEFIKRMISHVRIHRT